MGPNGGHWSEQGNWLDQLSNPVVPGLSSNVRILTPMSGAGAVYTASPMMSSTVRTLTVGAGSALTLTSGSLLIVSDNESGGTVVNEGLIRLQAGTGPDAGQFIELGVPTQLLELGSGVIELEGFHSGIGMTSPLSRTLRLLGTTVRGAGQLGRSSYAIENQGLIAANRAREVLELRPNFFLGSDVGLRNFGSLRAEGGGTLRLMGGLGRFDLASGTVAAVGAGSVVSMRAGAVLVGGVLMSSGGGVFRVDVGQTVTWLGTGVGSGAVVQVADGGTIFGGNAPGGPNQIVNHGQIVLGLPGDTVGASLRPNGGGYVESDSFGDGGSGAELGPRRCQRGVPGRCGDPRQRAHDPRVWDTDRRFHRS